MFADMPCVVVRFRQGRALTTTLCPKILLPVIVRDPTVQILSIEEN